jgi:hypothetical protein
MVRHRRHLTRKSALPTAKRKLPADDAIDGRVGPPANDLGALSLLPRTREP